MKFLKILAFSVALFTTVQAMQQPSSHTKGTPTGKPTGQLKPGEYWWQPQLSPSGPLMVLVSVPEQTMHVYRNGILIGRSTVSTGSKGHSTPGGVFSILGKSKEYYSKKYDNAPMPNMQRLTDTGICMHSGNLPGYPASHGCIRMPYDFSQLLFSVTASGGTVVVGDGKVPVPHLASSPGLLLAPKDLSAAMVRPLASKGFAPGRDVGFSRHDLRVDWLFSYQPTPGTVMFAGYGGSYDGPEHLRFRELNRTDDGFFVKLSYLFRM